MRLSKKLRSRTALASGLTVGAVGAALLVYPHIASAAIKVEVGSTTVTSGSVPVKVVPTASAVVITDDVTGDATPFQAADASKVQLTTGATCNNTYTTPTSAIVVATNTSTTTTVSFTLPAGVTANSNGQVKQWRACVYNGNTAGTSALESPATGYPILVGVPPTVSPTIGLTGGGNLLTVTAGAGGEIFTGVTAIGAQFVTDQACPATYGTPAAGTGTTATKVSNASATLNVPSGVTSTAATPTAYSLCLYNNVTTAATLISTVQYSASQLALSQTTGPWQGGNGLNITSPNQFLAGVDTVGVLFKNNAACPSTYDTTNTINTTVPVAAANVRKLSTTRLAATVPALRNAEPTTDAHATWNLCIYNGNSNGASPLIASNPYSVTIVQTSTGVTPKAGPALGGSRIIVTGTAFPTTPGAMTATLGGSPLIDIMPISSTAFEATTPMHAPANNVALVVSTAAGQHILSNAYSYTSALKVTPNTAPNTKAVDLIVNGVGFQSAPWSNTVTTGAHLFLVDGVYSGSENVATHRANPAVADCNNVLVLSDAEAICNLDLAERLDMWGEAAITTPAPAAPAATTIDTVVGSRIITGDAATFDEEMVGLNVFETTATNVPVNTTIIDVLSDTKAVLSANATATASNITVDLRTPIARSGVSIGTTNASTTITAAAGTFSQADVGSFVISSDVTIGTYIASVTDDETAVLSAAATGTSTPTADLRAATIPVPEGAYNLTYVSNAALGAVGTDPAYVQSLVSSGSTFTVSSF
jgi:hypothetical protein